MGQKESRLDVWEIRFSPESKTNELDSPTKLELERISRAPRSEKSGIKQAVVPAPIFCDLVAGTRGSPLDCKNKKRLLFRFWVKGSGVGINLFLFAIKNLQKLNKLDSRLAS